jgi:hypothetical protein
MIETERARGKRSLSLSVPSFFVHLAAVCALHNVSLPLSHVCIYTCGFLILRTTSVTYDGFYFLCYKSTTPEYFKRRKADLGYRCSGESHWQKICRLHTNIVLCDAHLKNVVFLGIAQTKLSKYPLQKRTHILSSYNPLFSFEAKAYHVSFSLCLSFWACA